MANDMHPAIAQWARQRLEAKAGGPVGDVAVVFYAENDNWSDGYNNGGGGVELGLYSDGTMISINLSGPQPDEDLLDIISEICAVADA